MKIIFRSLLLFALFFLKSTGFCQTKQANEQTNNITITLDFESAKEIIALLKKKTNFTESGLSRIEQLYGTLQLKRKVNSYDKGATDSVFRKTLREVALTGTVKGYDPFDWKKVKLKATEIEKLIQEIEKKGDFISEIRQRILPYSPSDMTVAIRACFLVGGGSLGFTIGNDNTFDVALQQIGDDYEGLVCLVAHELYHSIQNVGDRLRSEGKPAITIPKNIENTYILLSNLWSEGTANLVGDFSFIKNPKPFSKEQQTQFSRNSARTRQNFALFESMLYSAFYDSTANIQELYNIGFSVAFDETGYFTGYRIAKVIGEYMGKDALAKLINQNPIDMCKLYVSIYRSHPEKNIIQFSKSTETILDKMEPWSSKF